MNLFKSYFLIAMLAPVLAFSRISPAADDYTFAHSMEEYIAFLGGTNEANRQAAEVALSMFAATSYPKLLAESQRPGLSPKVAARLKIILNREKPRNEIRQRLYATRMITRQWNEHDVIDAYDRFGKKNPKWDADARKGILLFVDASTGQQRVPLEKAIEAGCNDPMVLYCEAHALEAWSPADRKSIGRFYELAMDGFEKSDYPAMRMAYSAANFFRYKLNEVERKDPAIAQTGIPVEVAHKLDIARALSYGIWAKVVEEKVPSPLLITLADQILDMYDARQGDRKVQFDSMYAALEKGMPDSSTLYLFKGDFYIKYAWEARGGGYANTVTPEKWKLFYERLAIADEALNKAWDRDPHDERIPSLMLTVELGEHKGIDVERKWFARAMSINPDDQAACNAVLDYLQPRWYGTVAEVLKFGRECYDSGNWQGGIPAKLISAHGYLAVNFTDAEKTKYYSQPAVWRDIQFVYIPYQSVVPKNYSSHSEYALLAAQAGHWDIAKQQFEMMGNNAVPSKFGGLEMMQKIRAEAETRGAGVATP